MSEYPLTLEEVVGWFRLKTEALGDSGLTVVAMRERESTDKPAACADFDSAYSLGQIAFWVSGEIDFCVLRIADGKDVFLRHEKLLA